VQLRQGVTVIAVDEQLTAHLTEEFHYAVGRVTLEGVSGGRDEGEEALPCAKRELREELGIEAAEWLDLGPLDPVTSIIAAPVRLFLARKLRFVEKEPEGTEQILHVTMPLKEAVERVMAGDITHAATCVAILKTARLLA
jgi:ADP-ribose pyrophosphatase